MKHTRHTAFLQAFGHHLRILRKSKGLSQEGLAFTADLELSQISRIERGIINTSLSQVLQIAQALDTPIKNLFDFEYMDLK